MRLLTLEGTYAQAVRLYESEGFVVTERVPPSPEGCPHYTLLWLQKDL